MAAHPIAQPFRYGGSRGLVELRNQLIREILLPALVRVRRALPDRHRELPWQGRTDVYQVDAAGWTVPAKPAVPAALLRLIARVQAAR
jgi:hypothetical protein